MRSTRAASIAAQVEVLRQQGALPGEAGDVPRRQRVHLSRVLGGVKAKASGDAFERRLAELLDLGEMEGAIAWWGHFGPPISRSGPGGRNVRVIGDGPADFLGQLAGGRTFAFEAKSREGRLRHAEIPEHQQKHLAKCALGGGIGLLLYERRDGARVRQFSVPWLEVPWNHTWCPEGSIGPEDLKRWELPPGAPLSTILRATEWGA